MQQGSVWLAGVLVAIALIASPSSAQEFPDLPDNPEAAACLVFEAQIEGAIAFCDEIEAEVGACNPTDKDCDKLCNVGSRTCQKANKDVVKTVNNVINGLIKEFKILCGGVSEPKDCKSGVKAANKFLRDAIKIAKKDLNEACKADSLVEECAVACTTANIASCSCDESGSLSCSVPG